MEKQPLEVHNCLLETCEAGPACHKALLRGFVGDSNNPGTSGGGG